MRLLCVYANRKMAVVLTNFSAMFPFVTCVKESENQANGFGESHRKSQPRGGGGTPLYGLYRYVPRNRVWFLEVLDP